MVADDVDVHCFLQIQEVIGPADHLPILLYSGENTNTWLLMTLMSTASCKSKKRVIARALMIGPADHLPIMLYSGEKYMTIDEINVFWVLQIQFDSHCKVIEGVDDGRNRLFANNALLREEVGGS